MSDELRAKLMVILGSSINFKGLADDWFIKHTEDVAEIEQAFKDAGYVNHAWRLDEDKGTPLELLLSGREWYDRLLLEVDTNRYHESDPEYAAQQEVLRAARKAAGLNPYEQ